MGKSKKTTRRDQGVEKKQETKAGKTPEPEPITPESPVDLTNELMMIRPSPMVRRGEC